MAKKPAWYMDPTRVKQMDNLTTWQELRDEYEAAAVASLPKLTARLWELAADDFELLCAPALLADVPALLPRFAAALRAVGVDRRSIAIYMERIGDALAWGSGGGVPMAAA